MFILHKPATLSQSNSSYGCAYLIAKRLSLSWLFLLLLLSLIFLSFSFFVFPAALLELVSSGYCFLVELFIVSFPFSEDDCSTASCNNAGLKSDPCFSLIYYTDELLRLSIPVIFLFPNNPFPATFSWVTFNWISWVLFVFSLIFSMQALGNYMSLIRYLSIAYLKVLLLLLFSLFLVVLLLLNNSFCRR